MNFEDKMQTFKDQFFLPRPAADLENITMAQYLSPLQSLELGLAIYKPNSDKAPGINGLSNWLFKQVFDVFLSQFTQYFQACVNLGYHLKEFWVANTIVLRKSKKSNYTLTELYRPIALLNTLDKALKAIMACHLSKLAEKANLLSPQQIRARKDRSMEIALKMLVESMYTV